MNMNATVHEMDIWSILSSQCHKTCKVTAIESLIGVGGGGLTSQHLSTERQECFAMSDRADRHRGIFGRKPRDGRAIWRMFFCFNSPPPVPAEWLVVGGRREGDHYHLLLPLPGEELHLLQQNIEGRNVSNIQILIPNM